MTDVIITNHCPKCSVMRKFEASGGQKVEHRCATCGWTLATSAGVELPHPAPFMGGYATKATFVDMLPKEPDEGS